jgi:hypothetical protein
MGVQASVVFDADRGRHDLPQPFDFPSVFTTPPPGIGQPGQLANAHAAPNVTDRAARNRVSVLLKLLHGYEMCGKMLSGEFKQSFSELLLLLGRLTSVNGTVRIGASQRDVENALSLLLRVMEFTSDARLLPGSCFGLR